MTNRLSTRRPLRRISGWIMLMIFVCMTDVIPAETAAERAISGAVAKFKMDGFVVRRDSLRGEILPGEKSGLDHQLYRGNEYWFWLGWVPDGLAVSLKVYGANGRPVDVETRSDQKWKAVRVLPPKTGKYTVVFVFEVDPETAGKKAVDKSKPVDWAMRYGYR